VGTVGPLASLKTTIPRDEVVMTVVRNANFSAPRRSGTFDRNTRDTVSLRAYPYGGAIVVGAVGELDASNFGHFADYVRIRLSGQEALILDLSQLNFFGAQGIRHLLEIANECEGNGIKWALLPSDAVTRLLKICDKDVQLPAVTSIDEALQGFSPISRNQLLKLVPKSG
jgi:anti-anti-sigma factor